MMNKLYIYCQRKHGYSEARNLFNLMKFILDFGKEKNDENN